MRYRVSYSYDRIYHILTSDTMQRNNRSQQLFGVIGAANQIFDTAGNVLNDAAYGNDQEHANYSIASVFMRSENAPNIPVVHVLVANGNEQQAFNFLLHILDEKNLGLNHKVLNL